MNGILDLEQVRAQPESSLLDLNLVRDTGTVTNTDPAQDNEPLLDLGAVRSQTPEAFLEQRKNRLLSNVNVQFGGEVEPWRGSKSFFRGLFEEDPITNFDRLHEDLQDLLTNEPELASTPQGQAYISDIKSRARSVLNAKEIDISDTLTSLANEVVSNPGSVAESFADATIEDPTFPIVFAASFALAGKGSALVARSGLMGRVLQTLAAGTTRQRQAAILLEKSIQATGIVAAEAGLGAVYEIAQNRSIGQDPHKNVAQAAALNAMLAGGFIGLNTAYKLLKGYPGRYKTVDDFVADIRQDMIDNGVAPDKVDSVLDDVIRNLVDNMEELPKGSGAELLNKRKIKQASGTKVFNPDRERQTRIIDPGDFNKIVADVTQKYGATDLPGDLGVTKIYQNRGLKAPVGTDKSRGLRYNLNQIIEDFKNGYGFLKGEKQSGVKGKSGAARSRALAFHDFDFNEFHKWIMRKGGAKAYGEFLMKLEANKLQYTRHNAPRNPEFYRMAMRDTFQQYGENPVKFQRGFTNKAKAKIDSGYTYAKATAAEIASDPALLWRPIKDILLGGKQFVEDIRPFKPGRETMASYAKSRREMSNMLRDWEGGRMAGELSVNDFANFVKARLKTQDKLMAMSHHLEGNLEGFNKYRQSKGLDRIDLSEADLEIAPAIRKYFNTTLNWAQRAELFKDFRNDKKLYNQARNIHAGVYDKSGYRKPVDYVQDKPYQQLVDEMWDFVKGLDDPRDLAYKITPESKRYSDHSTWLRSRENYVPHVTTGGKFAPDEVSVWRDTLADAHRAAQLQTTSRFTKPRTHETMVDALEAGETLLTEDISKLIPIYGKSLIRAQLNNRLLGQLNKMRSLATGKPMLGTKDEVPDWYVEFKHPNFKTKDGYMHVNPNIAPDLRLYFDTNDPNIINRVLQNIILISKRSALGLSGFHMTALAWSGLAAGIPVNQVLRNLFPVGRGLRSKGLKAIAGEEGYEEVMAGIRNGLGIGVLEELKGDTLINAMRRLGEGTEKLLAKNQYLKPIGKMGNMGWRGLARAQEIIDRHLWDHVNTGLKATSYLVNLEKLILKDAKRAAKEGTPLTDKNLLRQRAAQYTNDAFGNQNWNQMAMNVQNRIGHRFAAALNKPSMRGYVRMLVFAPDWSFSNMRVIGKSLDVKDKAHPLYMSYALRSALLFAFAAEALQQTAGQGSIFDDDLKDALRPDLGDGKQMEISKQLAEVVRIFIHGPAHVALHKMGTLPKTIMADDPLGEFLGRSIPISLQQGIKEGGEAGVSGALGAPIYGK
jgi:hypothetical protein